VAGSTEGEGLLARDALTNSPQRLLETGKPVAVKAARRVWEEAVGKGLMSVSTSLAAYFISISTQIYLAGENAGKEAFPAVFKRPKNIPSLFALTFLFQEAS
jgi:hypothetical protein